MTEASPAPLPSPTIDAPAKPGSIGQVVPNTEVKIVDIATARRSGAGASTASSWNPGDRRSCGATSTGRRTRRSRSIATGGINTGDVGYVDDEDWFYVVDRTKELIKYKGLQVAPAELEALRQVTPPSLDAAVIRRADEEAGEVPGSHVVLEGRRRRPRDERGRAHGLGRGAGGAPTSRVRHVEFIDQIPKSASGKVLRRVLLDRERAR